MVGLVGAARDSPTVDEAIDVASGLVAVEHRDLRMVPEHGVLPRVLAAVPVALFADPIVPRDDAYERGDWFDHTDSVIRANDEAGRLDRILFLSRLVPIGFGVGVGFALYALGRRLFGPAEGTVAAALWLGSPVAVGHAHFAMIDVPFTLTVLLLSLVLLRDLERPTAGSAALIGCTLAVSLLTRHSAVVLVPAIAAVVVVARRTERRDAVVALGVIGVVTLASMFAVVRAVDVRPVDGEPRERFDALIDGVAAENPAFALVMAVPAPVEWKAGFAYLVETNDARPSWLAGQSWEGGRWWFFPASALLKLPLLVTLVLLAAAGGWARVAAEERRRALLVVAAPAGLYAAFLLVQELNTGVRMAFPVLALVMVLAGPSIRLVSSRAREATMTVGALVLLGGMVVAAPHSLAWSPWPFTPAHRWVSDSNVDFGQDLGELRGLASKGELVAATYLAPRGLDDVIDLPDVRGAAPEAMIGTIAVSTTRLTVLDRDELSWLRAYCPVGSLGGSILLFTFDEPPDVSPGPDRPRDFCDGDVSRRS